MERLLEVEARTFEPVSVQGSEKMMVMIPFTAKAKGPYFQGELIGQGVDTQTVYPGEAVRLSARYMLEGTDHTGKNCRIFIENNGSDFSHMDPVLVTDSEALKDWESAEIYDTVEPIEGGVKITFYKR